MYLLRGMEGPGHIILGGPSRNIGSSMELDEVEEGLDIVLQKIFDTKVTLTIKELAAISPALTKAVADEKFGDFPLKGSKRK